MKTIYTSLLTTLFIFSSLLGFGQKIPKWGSNFQLTTKLATINLTEDETFPDFLNLSIHPMIQILPGLSFKSYRGRTAYRIDVNYAQNYTNSEVSNNDSAYFSEANHSNLEIQFGFEHKFLPGRIYPYCFAMISVGYHNALGNSYGLRNPVVFDFKIFDINAGLTGGYGFYFFIFKQLSLNAEMNVLLLNTWNNFTQEVGSSQGTWNYYDFSVRSAGTFGMNYYFNLK